MTTSPSAKDVRSARKALLALALAAFCIGTSEYVVSGLLTEIAHDLSVDVPRAGLLVTGYALGVAIGGPVLGIATMGFGCRRLLVVLVGIFLAGNVVCAVAPNYAVLLAGRLLCAVAHGTFYGIAAVAAAAMAPERKRASAIAFIGTGMTVATLVGVPAGTALGQACGWQATFAATSLLALLALVMLWRFLPVAIEARPANLALETAALSRPGVLIGLGSCVVMTTGLFAVFTYLATMAIDIAGAGERDVAVLMLLFGCGATVGMLTSGRLADRNLTGTIGLTFAGQVPAYGALLFGAESLPVLMAAAFALGATGLGAVTPLKLLVLRSAGDAQRLASTFASSALNLGAALGAGLGATMLSLGFAFSELAMPGLVCGMAVLAVLAIRVRPAAVRPI